MSVITENWQTLKEEMRHILIHRAKKRQPIAYSELAKQLQTAYVHYRAPAFNRLILEVSRDELEAGHPSLAVLVVNKQTGRCGSGYFKAAAVAGYDVSDPEAFWQMRFKEVCDYWE